MKNHLSLIVLLFICLVQAQTYAPQVGFEGTTAIHKDNTAFIDWANSVTITRGYKNVAIPSSGYADYGVETNALGEANASIVSLGDEGEAILSFNYPITNGNGADFAVFENGFLEDVDSEKAFLELAFVEVSTNGVEYVRFPAISENQIDTQIDGFGFMNARYIHNFAGKYIQDYGTPFDLSELIPLINGTTIDLNNINYIKLIDVIGAINTTYASYDSENNIVNDPYPSEFSSGGFDLNAVGVIHNLSTNSIDENNRIDFSIYPNPVDSLLIIESNSAIKKATIYSVQGKELIKTSNSKIDVSFLSKGIYFVLINSNTKIVKLKFVKF
jgi:hypothetical protein